MNDRYRLGGLEDDQLLASLSALVKRENDSLSDLLAHLAELDARQLCVAMGYSSLFAYCTEALGFCKSSAGRRIAAARVCRDFPEAFAGVAAGELQLSVLCALRPHLKTENASALFAACAGQSFEQVELLLAARFPRSDVRDLVRRLPAVKGTPDIGSGGVGAVRALSVDRFSVSFTADGEFRELLEEVRALMSHSVPRGELLTVMRRGLEALRGELLKKRFGVGRKPRSVRARESSVARCESLGTSRPRATQLLKRIRYVAAVVAREVYVRDGGRCTFCAEDGRRCGERRLLQLDHVVPFAEGGEATVGNLRLRCRSHNLHTAREYFGREYQRAAVVRAGARTVGSSGGVGAAVRA